jgi:hypothetical protein
VNLEHFVYTFVQKTYVLMLNDGPLALVKCGMLWYEVVSHQGDL